MCGKFGRLSGSSRRDSRDLYLPASRTLPDAVINLLKRLTLKENDYKEIMNLLEKEMQKGLNKTTHGSAAVKMFPSYVTQLPTGSEKGQALAVDLGGTNYRTLLLNFTGEKGEYTIKETAYAIPNSILSASHEDLFNYIADNLQKFVELHNLKDKQLGLGFTFSFPCEQRGLNSSILIQWTKGFSVKGVEGKDVATLLQQALDRRKMKIKCVAVVNDTVGTLTACALKEPKCAIGLIVGTGTNAAYIEKAEAVQTYQGSPPASGNMVINMEWGGFGSDGKLDPFRSAYDTQLDEQSLHPGKQIFEKMSSGLYLGELVRLILLDLISKKMIFDGVCPESFKKPNKFHCKYISDVERDPSGLYYSTNYMLTEDLNVPVVQTDDCRIVRYVCELIACRAAYLIGAGVACILNHMNRKHVVVGIDGSLFKFHPKFAERMTAMIHRLKKPNLDFVLRLSEDGSGKGAAVIAMSHVNDK